MPEATDFDFLPLWKQSGRQFVLAPFSLQQVKQTACWACSTSIYDCMACKQLETSPLPLSDLKNKDKERRKENWVSPRFLPQKSGDFSKAEEMHFLAVSATMADCDLYWGMEELLWEIRDAIIPYKLNKRAAAFSQAAADEDHIRICNSQAAMICKQLLLFHVIAQFWILPRGRTGQRPVFFFFVRSLLMTVSYRIYLWSFSWEEEIVGDRGQQGERRKRPTDKLAMEILGWML